MPKPLYHHEGISGGPAGERDEIVDQFLRGRPERREPDPYFYLDRNFRRAVVDLETVWKGKQKYEDEGEGKKAEEAAKEAGEKLPGHWEGLMEAQLEETEDILDDQLLRFLNPVPFETRQTELWFKSLNKGIRIARKEEWAQDIEAEYQLNNALIDVTWGDSNFRLLEGMAGGMDKFFDWSLVLNWVRERYRKDPIIPFYEKTFAENIRGLTLPEETEGESIEEKLKQSLREKAVKYQDEYRFWSLAVAAVHQLEYDGKTGKRKTFMRGKDEEEKEKETLTDAEIKFIQLLFGDSNEDNWLEYKGHKYPKEILNWPAMASIEIKKERYIATMQALLTEGTREKLSNPSHGIVDGRGGYNEDRVKDLVKEIEEKVNGRLDSWYSPDKTPDQRLADVVVKSGIVFDLGHRSTVHLAWGWKFEEEGGGVVRTVDSGGTTVATDVIAAAFWREDERSAQKKGWTSGPVPDMSEEYKMLLGEHAPNFKPKLEDLSENAAIDYPPLQNALRRFWKRLDSINPDLRIYFEDMIWYWETPYKTKREGGKNLVIPVFFPPVVESINYWDTVTDKEGGSVKKKIGQKDGKFGVKEGDPSLWDQFCAGVKLSEVEWKNLGDQGFYRHLITIAQTNRILSIMKKKPSEVKDQFAAFFLTSENIDELRKRGELAVRDEKLPLPVLAISIAPMLIVIATAKKRGIISEKGFRPRELGKWVSGDLAQWRKELKNTPAERDGVKGYRDGMVALFDLYSTLFVSLAYRVGDVKLEVADEERNELLEIIKKDTSVKIDILSTKLEEEEARPDILR